MSEYYDYGERMGVWLQLVGERTRNIYTGIVDFEGEEYPYEIVANSVKPEFEDSTDFLQVEGKLRYTGKLPPQNIRVVLANSALETFIEDRFTELKDKIKDVSIEGKRRVFPFVITIELPEWKERPYSSDLEGRLRKAVENINSPSFEISSVYFTTKDLPTIEGQVTIAKVTDSYEAVMPEIQEFIDNALRSAGVHLENIELEEKEPGVILVRVEGKFTGDFHEDYPSAGYYEIYEASINKKAFLKSLLEKLRRHTESLSVEDTFHLSDEEYKNLLKFWLSPEEIDELNTYFDIDFQYDGSVVLSLNDLGKKVLKDSTIDIYEKAIDLKDIAKETGREVKRKINPYTGAYEDVILIPKNEKERFEKELEAKGLKEYLSFFPVNEYYVEYYINKRYNPPELTYVESRKRAWQQYRLDFPPEQLLDFIERERAILEELIARIGYFKEYNKEGYTLRLYLEPNTSYTKGHFIIEFPHSAPRNKQKRLDLVWNVIESFLSELPDKFREAVEVNTSQWEQKGTKVFYVPFEISYSKYDRLPYPPKSYETFRKALLKLLMEEGEFENVEVRETSEGFKVFFEYKDTGMNKEELQKWLESRIIDIAAQSGYDEVHVLPIECDSFNHCNFEIRLPDKPQFSPLEGELSPGGYFALSSVKKTALLKSLLRKLEQYNTVKSEGDVFVILKDIISKEFTPEEIDELNTYFDREIWNNNPDFVVLTLKDFAKEMLPKVVDEEKFLPNMEDIYQKIQKTFNLGIQYSYGREEILVPKGIDDRFQEALKELKLDGMLARKGEEEDYLGNKYYVYDFAPDIDYKVPEIRRRVYEGNYRVPGRRIHIMRNVEKNKRVISSYRRKKEGSYRMRNKPRRVFIKKRQPKKASIEKEAKWVDWYEYIDPITGRRVIKQADVSQPPDKIIEDEIIELRGDMNDLFKKMLGRMNREITALKREVARLRRQREILKRRAFKESNFEKWVNYWNSLTGDAEHKFKQCIKKVSEAGFAKDSKKFCGGLRNFVERTTERKRKRSSKRTVTLRDVLRRRAALRKLRAMKRKAAEEVTITTDDGRKVKVLVRNASFKPVRAEAEEQQAPVTPPEPPKQPVTHDEVKEVAEQATPQQQPNNNESVSLRDTIVHQLAAIFGVPSDSVRILNAEVTQPAKEDGNLIITITYKVGEEGAKKTAHVLVTKKTAIIKAANITSKVNFNGKKVLYDIPTKTIINEKGEIVTGEEKPMVAVAPSDVDVPAGFTDIAVENALTVESNNPTTPNIAVSASTSKDPELVRLATIVTDTLIRKGILEPDRRKEQIQVYLAHYDDPNALKSILNVLNKIGDGDTIYVNEKGVPVDLKDIF